MLRKGENQILDYQAQQYKLFPLLGFSHACKATFVTIMNTYKNATENLEKGDLATLPELHAISSGLKAVCSELSSKSIEICRLACGGHGFLLASGLPRLYATTVAACTYEGENTVLYLQTARFIFKCLRGEQPLASESSFNYLLEPIKSIPQDLNTDDLSPLVRLYQCASYKQIHRAASELKRRIDEGFIPELSWNACQIDLIKASKAHILYYIVLKYVDWVYNSQVSSELKLVLTRLCRTYLIYNILENSGPYIQAGLSIPQLEDLQNQMVQLLTLLRPDAIPLVDSFDFHDLVLNSALGSSDGQVYERLYNLAQKAPLNKTQVHESYFKYLHQYKSKL